MSSRKKNFIHPLKFISKLYFNFRNPLLTSFYRLTPNHKGKIYFFNREVKKIFHVYSRGIIDSNVVDQVYTNHDYRIRFRSQDVSEEYLRIVESGKTPLIIDCGSNVGVSTLFFGERYPQAMVVAIEPDQDNLSIAYRNCSNLTNVKFIHGAVGAVGGTVKVSNPQDDPWAYQVERIENIEGINLFTIDEILNSHSELVPYLIKIDIEGFENDLFSANTDWINRFYVLIIELHDWLFPKMGNSQNFLKTIGNHNRDFVYIGENIFSIKF